MTTGQRECVCSFSDLILLFLLFTPVAIRTPRRITFTRSNSLWVLQSRGVQLWHSWRPHAALACGLHATHRVGGSHSPCEPCCHVGYAAHRPLEHLLLPPFAAWAAWAAHSPITQIAPVHMDPGPSPGTQPQERQPLGPTSCILTVHRPHSLWPDAGPSQDCQLDSPALEHKLKARIPTWRQYHPIADWAE